MWRALLIIILILIAIPFLHKADDYLAKQSKRIKDAGKAAMKSFNKDDKDK